MRTTTLRAFCAVFVVAALATAVLSGQAQNPRFGKWKFKSEAPPPSSNIVTYEILTNVLSPDGNTIGVMYMRMDPEGKKTTNVTFATYDRIQ